jgi:hypothetical protein
MNNHCSELKDHPLPPQSASNHNRKLSLSSPVCSNTCFLVASLFISVGLMNAYDYYLTDKLLSTTNSETMDQLQVDMIIV